MENIKEIVKEQYGKIAAGQSSCGCQGGCGSSTAAMAEVYPSLGKEQIANLGLGCGTPTEYAEIRDGMTVLDLGSGAGIDVFIASRYVGSAGRVIGVDFTEQMIARATQNARSLGMSNVEFLLGDIEQLPLPPNSIDRIISNCVINLVPDKQAAFVQLYRVLKPGGMFVLLDIVRNGELSDEIRQDPEMWSSCVAGADEREHYLQLLRDAGFTNVEVLKQTPFTDVSLKKYPIASITVRGTK